MEGAADFGRLPGGCFSYILSLTSPRDACTCSAVSSFFRSAAQADAVWERFLPSDYLEILARSDGTVEFSSKKELYFRLCTTPILIDGGKISFSLEKASGKKCYRLSARELLIIWGDVPRSWRWVSLPESRFSEVAELLSVHWLEIQGKINTYMLSSNTNYAAYMLLKFTDEASGLDYQPTELLIRVGGFQVSKHTAYLLAQNSKRQHHEMIVGLWQTLHTQDRLWRIRAKIEDIRIPRERTDGWMEVELGKFFIPSGAEGEVEMSLMDARGGNLKVGLIIEGIELRPLK